MRGSPKWNLCTLSKYEFPCPLCTSTCIPYSSYLFFLSTDMVMTQEFYHYFVSLLSVMKMNASQTARHLTGVWETILGERLGTSTVPPEYRKIITLSKQTVSEGADITPERQRGTFYPSCYSNKSVTCHFLHWTNERPTKNSVTIWATTLCRQGRMQDHYHGVVHWCIMKPYYTYPLKD